MTHPALWILLLATFVVSGCSGDFLAEENPIRRLMGYDSRENPAVLDQIEQLAISDAPVLVVLIEEREALGAMFQAQVSGETSAWLSADNSMIVLDHGLIIATRGLGWDLMSLDFGNIFQPLFADGGSEVVKTYRFLDGEDQIRATRFSCQILSRGQRSIEIEGTNHETRLMRESCHNEQSSFQNLYWISKADNSILQSRQWAGSGIGIISLRPSP